MKKTPLTLAALLAATSAQAAPNDQWNGTGPFATGQGNRAVRALAVSPDGMTAYAGTGSGTAFIYRYSDTTAPLVSGAAISAIGQTGATLTATSNESATGYWVVVAANATAPTSAQVKAGTGYGGVTVVAHGAGAMGAAVAAGFPIAGLTAGTAYDLYFAAEDGSGNLLATPLKLQFATTATPSDTVPDPFSFTPQIGVAPGTVATSDTVVITGIDAPSPIAIVGGSYAIDGGAYLTTPGTVNNGQSVTVRLTAAAAAGTTTAATLTVGGVSGTFQVTTAEAAAVPTLSEWALWLLGGLLWVSGIWTERRRGRV